jgi:SSS family solute:Na+ symporter
MLVYIGIIIVLTLIVIVSILSGRRVKNIQDFSCGGMTAGVGVVMGTISGTLVGGAATIGTAQLAFLSGLSAWWFTLGGGIGCLILAFFFSKHYKEAEVQTMPQIITKEFGKTAGTIVALLTSAGGFLSIVAQVLSGIALTVSITGFSTVQAAISVVGLMLIYVIFGGVWSSGYVGIVKMILLYFSIGVCGVLALSYGGGMEGLLETLPRDQYFHLFSRGIMTDLSNGFSLILGILTTQAYISAIISAKSVRAARTGAVWSAILMPLIGAGAILVGLFMKVNYPDMNPSLALPTFVMEYMPPLLSGIVIATLLVTLVGTGAGMALGLGSVLTYDIYGVFIGKKRKQNTLYIIRIIIFLVLFSAAVLAVFNSDSLILDWSFLSMGLRGATAFGVLVVAVYFPRKIPSQFAIASMVLGPTFVILERLWFQTTIDPLVVGVGVSLLVLVTGKILMKK